MTIFVNDKEFNSFSPILTLATLADELNIKPEGVAIAVNNKVVRKALWLTTHLAEGDKVTVITAVCGG